MARPNRLKEIAAERGVTPELMVARALHTGKTISAAKDIIGVTYQTLWAYVKAHPDLFKKDFHWTYAGDEIDAEIINEE